MEGAPEEVNYVMDASALIAFLDAEQGGSDVDVLLGNQGNTCLAHAISICEVYYDFVRRADKETAWVLIEELVRAGIHIRDDMDPELWEDAGAIKAKWRRISLADCFCVALARRADAELVTADRMEIHPLAQAGLCHVRLLR